MDVARERGLWEENLGALRKRSPEYADMLTATFDDGGYVFGSPDAAGSAVTCRDSTGKWVHGPDDPWAAARREAERFVSDEPQLYVVLRPGLGYLALAVLEALEEHESESIVLVAEDRLPLVRSALSLIDWGPILRSRSAVLRLGNLETTILSYLARHPAVSLLPICVVAPPDLDPNGALGQLTDRMMAISQTTQASIEGDLGNVASMRQARSVRAEPLRVLLAGDYFGYLSAPIADGFRANACSVHVDPNGDETIPRTVRAHDWILSIANYRPDVVLWMNRPNISRLAREALKDLGIANVRWSVDSPRRFRLRRTRTPKADLHLCFDPCQLDDVARAESLSSCPLSLGAGIEPLPGCGSSAGKWPERLGPDVTFVGAFGETRVRHLREQLSHSAPEELAFLDELARSASDPLEAFEQRTGKFYEGVPCMYVDEVRATRRRIQALEALSSLDLKIFGPEDWARAPRALSARYANRGLRYGSDLASVYYHSHVNVNIFHEQCVDSTNSRVYDVLAAGGFLLTEHRPCLETEFEIGRHLITFSEPAEAVEKANYYLRHVHEREAIAREGQKHVLAHHTFVHRCQRILELAKPYIG